MEAQSTKPAGKRGASSVGSLSHCAEAVPLYTALSNSAPLTSIVEVVLTFSFNMLNKKLERMTSKPNDTESEEPITIGVTLSTSSGPKFVLPQMLKA